jgi:hypothetical protein
LKGLGLDVELLKRSESGEYKPVEEVKKYEEEERLKKMEAMEAKPGNV